MCSPAKCRVCGKTTWSGCGQHVAAVKASVPAGNWCNGKHSQAEIAAQEKMRAEAKTQRRSENPFARLFGR